MFAKEIPFLIKCPEIYVYFVVSLTSETGGSSALTRPESACCWQIEDFLLLRLLPFTVEMSQKINTSLYLYFKHNSNENISSITKPIKLYNSIQHLLHIGYVLKLNCKIVIIKFSDIFTNTQIYLHIQAMYALVITILLFKLIA